jgi:histidyl-tRNA synthetase
LKNMIEPRVLKGFRDYLPDIMIPREELLNRVSEVFRRYGFGPLATPALEYSEILMGKYGEEGDKLLYRFLDNGERDISLRYDLTVPLARVVAMHRELPRPFRRYQVAPVWRAEKPGRGRFREFMQCDADIVGSSSLAADAECVRLGCAILTALGVREFTLVLNNRKILDGIMEVTRVRPRAEAIRVLDKLDKIGVDAVRTELLDTVGLTPEQVDDLEALFSLDFLKEGGRDSVRATLAGSEVGTKGVEELAHVLSLLSPTGVLPRLRVNLSLARGMDYYTGTIYETFLDGHTEYGSVMSGGRYDGLVGVFSNEEIPAVGISLGVDRLLAALTELGVLKARSCLTRVLVVRFGPGSLVGEVEAVERLRAAGIACEHFLEAGKLGKQFQYADRQGIPLAVVRGPDEVAQGVCQVKSLTSGEQFTVPLEELVGWVRARLEL